MNLPKELTTVTSVSKFLTLVLLLSLPFVGFLLGLKYQQQFIEYLESRASVDQYMLKTQPAATQSASTASPAPNGDKANWKTYRSEKYGYELKYPLSFNIKEYDNYTLFTNNTISLSIINYNTGTDQPILNTELIKVGGENAKRYNHILGKFPNQVGFIIIQLSHNNKDLTITAQSLNQKPLSVDQIESVDQILSTFKFSNP